MRQVELSRGQVALVDDTDFGGVSGSIWHAWWSPDSEAFYAATHVGRKYVYMHRSILGLGDDDRRCVDHIDRNPLNNQRNNLRICTRAENQRNSGKRSNNTSGYKGVSYAADRQKFHAKIRVNGKTIHLGRYCLAEDAARAYDVAARRLHGEFAYLNFR